SRRGRRLGRGAEVAGGLRPGGGRAGAPRRRAGRLALGVPRRGRVADRPASPRRAGGRMDSGTAVVKPLDPKGFFSRDYEPAVTVDPGEPVVFATLNAGWRWDPEVQEP